MRQLCAVTIVLALALVMELGAYVTSLQVRSVRNSWVSRAYYPGSSYYSNADIVPACTLRAELKPYGTRGTLDLDFKAAYTGFSAGDSLEIISTLTLPVGATVDSMILWIYGNEEPAKHISVGQANATYNNIVIVTRRDPAFLKRKGVSYADNSYELKVFPIFRDSTRHVRIFIHYPLTHNGDSARAVSLGKPHPAAVLLTPGTGVEDIPTSLDGSLKLQMVDGRLVLRAAADYGKEVKILYGKGAAVVEPGVFGYVDATFPDTGYFHLEADLGKIFNLTDNPYSKRITFVWVPSTSYSSNAYDAFVYERGLFADYLKTFEREDDFNFYYAGASVVRFQAHMVPATAAFKSDAGIYLNGLPAPSSPDDARENFEALKQAFASIAAADTPAVVFCMDRETAYVSGLDYTKINQMVTALVQINVNRAKFYAWVHPSKVYFYSLLAQSLKGTMVYSLSTLDSPFKPQIKNPKITFITPVWDVLDQGYYGYGYSYYYPYYYSYPSYNQFKYEGKCPKGPLLMDASIEVGTTVQKKRIYIGGMGTKEQGATVHKSWTQGIVSAIQTSYYSMIVQNPTAGTASLWSMGASSASTYKALVGLSIQKGVLTNATALLALEPGMQLSEEDDPGNAGWGGGPVLGIDSPKKCRTPDSCAAVISAVPNPFNPSTRIEVSGVEGAATLELMIYAVDGKLIRKMVSQVRGGRALFEWEGRSSRGERLTSGVYVARVRAGNRILNLKLYLAK